MRRGKKNKGVNATEESRNKQLKRREKKGNMPCDSGGREEAALCQVDVLRGAPERWASDGKFKKDGETT